MLEPTNLPTSANGHADLALPRPIQEHLARHLRAAYVEQEDRPAYLGDPALPVAFDEHLYRLAADERSRERQRAGECGLAAVTTALAGAEARHD